MSTKTKLLIFFLIISLLCLFGILNLIPFLNRCKKCTSKNQKCEYCYNKTAKNIETAIISFLVLVILISLIVIGYKMFANFNPRVKLSNQQFLPPPNEVPPETLTMNPMYRYEPNNIPTSTRVVEEPESQIKIDPALGEYIESQIQGGPESIHKPIPTTNFQEIDQEDDNVTNPDSSENPEPVKSDEQLENSSNSNLHGVNLNHPQIVKKQRVLNPFEQRQKIDSCQLLSKLIIQNIRNKEPGVCEEHVKKFNEEDCNIKISDKDVPKTDKEIEVFCKTPI